MSYICSFTFAPPIFLPATLPLGSLSFRVTRSTSIFCGHLQFFSPRMSLCISFVNAFSVLPSVFFSSSTFILSSFIAFQFQFSFRRVEGLSKSFSCRLLATNVRRPRRYYLCFIFQTTIVSVFLPFPLVVVYLFRCIQFRVFTFISPYNVCFHLSPPTCLLQCLTSINIPVIFINFYPVRFSVSVT